MTNNSKTIEYDCRKRITNPEVIRFAREFENNPFTPTGKDIMYNFFKSIGMDIDYDEIFSDYLISNHCFTFFSIIWCF